MIDGHVESCVKSLIAQQGRRKKEIGGATIVESEADTLLGTFFSFSDRLQGFANIPPAPPVCSHECKLVSKLISRHDISHVTRIVIAELQFQRLEFVIHQKNYALTHEKIFRSCAFTGAGRFLP